MKKRIFKFSLCALLSIILCLSSFVSCVEKPSENTAPKQKREEFTPSGENYDSKGLDKRYDDYKEKAELAFASSAEATASDFGLEETEGGICIKSYVGKDDVVVVPEEIDGKAVICVREGAFSKTNVKSVSIPESVVTIEQGAFADCDTLVTLRLPITCKSESDSFFGYIFGADEYAKNAVAVPAGLDMVIINRNIDIIPENYFSGCKGISAIIMPDGVEKIEKFAFYECADLVFLDLGGSVTNIENYAFGYCLSLYKLDISSAKSIGRGALIGCRALKQLSVAFVGGSAEENQFIGYIFGADRVEHNEEFVPKALLEVNVTSCSYIPDNAFAGCQYIGKVNISEGVEDIGVRAFYNCRSLTEISLPGSIKSIDDNAFFGCDNLKSVYLGQNLENIGMQAFFGCSALESIIIPEGVEKIEPSTFYGCRSLENIELSDVKDIGKGAFFGCDSLTPPDISKVLNIADGNDALYSPQSDTTGANK